MFKLFLKILIEKIWYSKNFISFLLLPLSWIYIFFVELRLKLYQFGIFPINKSYAPTIIVGNMVAGGTGKTPLVIWLACYYKEQGFFPGVISKGYKGRYTTNTQFVDSNTDPILVGDEPVLIAKKTKCPVLVGNKRSTAAQEIVEKYKCNLIISDDGLQHYSLARNIEIAVIDGQRRLGNGFCIPAGPLRELKSRLDSVDLVVGKYLAKKSEYKMEYIYNDLVSLNNPKDKMPITDLDSKKIHVVSGISNPQSFYSYLRSQNYELLIHEYPDHHIYNENDLKFDDDFPVVMTEKDAVKCFKYSNERYWYLPISAKLSERFTLDLNELLERNKYG